MNRGVGAKNLFESQTGGIAAAVAQGEKVWAALFPGGNSTFIFNTNCFYDPGTGDDDEASPSPAPGPGPSPGPAPSGACAAAIAKAMAKPTGGQTGAGLGSARNNGNGGRVGKAVQPLSSGRTY